MRGHFPLHPLGHPNCAALRVRCVARSAGDARKLASLRHRAHLFPGSPVLLARADGDLGAVQWSSPASELLTRHQIVPTLCVGMHRRTLCVHARCGYELARAVPDC